MESPGFCKKVFYLHWIPWQLDQQWQEPGCRDQRPEEGAAPESQTQRCHQPEQNTGVSHPSSTERCSSPLTGAVQPCPSLLTLLLSFRPACAPSQGNKYPPHCFTMWLSTQKLKMPKWKVFCSSLLYVRSVFLQLFSFCQETISQKCCEFMQVSKVARTPSLKENNVTFVPTGYWKKLSFHFLNGEHRPYHAQLASASPAANQL